ncbi:MAG: hypothetical protein P4L35_07020 [Ignavibacteriaceae bacterium]|nr:hypothetical protein [Ignavibacteriaceae bacterium]
MNYSKWLMLIFSSIFMLVKTIDAQPYIYSAGSDTLIDSISNTPTYNIYKINLSNGQKEIYGLGDQNVSWDNTQSWVINGIDDYTFHGISNSFIIPIYPYCAVYSPISSKLFILGNEEDSDVLSVINSLTGEEELSLSLKATSSLNNKQMFLSSDNSRLYFAFYDTVFIPLRENKIKIAELSTSTNRIVQTKNLQDIGFPGSDGYSIKEGKNGKAIIVSYFSNHMGYHYNIYNFEKDSSSSFIYHQGDSHPYYTNNGKYLVVNLIDDSLDVDPGVIHRHNTGLFEIYDVTNQLLVKSIQLPPRRDVYTFDNFPNNIYYYDHNTETAITLNIDSLVNNSSSISNLTPAITFPGFQNFTLEVKGSNFSTNSSVLWNGNERKTALVSDSILHAVINASDISTRGNYRVTVKTGYDISDTLMFSVVDSLTIPVHPILECVQNNGNGTFTAHFGYQNDLDKTVLVPIGGQNSLSPGQSDRGQTTIFYPGKHADVFTVDFDGSNISWILDMQMKSASSSSPPCN